MSEIEKLKSELAKAGLQREHPTGRLLGARWQAYADHADDIVPRDILDHAHRAAQEFCPAILRNFNAFQFNKADQSFSFDYSPDFDHSPEPILAASFTVHTDGSSQFVPIGMDPVIWPHKWLWVTDDYKGFDVKASMQRSLWLCQLSPMAEQKKHHRRAAWMGYLEKLMNGRPA